MHVHLQWNLALCVCIMSPCCTLTLCMSVHVSHRLNRAFLYDMTGANASLSKWDLPPHAACNWHMLDVAHGAIACRWIADRGCSGSLTHVIICAGDCDGNGETMSCAKACRSHLHDESQDCDSGFKMLQLMLPTLAAALREEALAINLTVKGGPRGAQTDGRLHMPS